MLNKNNPVEEILKTFENENVSVNSFNFKNKNQNDFWEFLKNQTKKGVYVFLNLERQGEKRVVYVGKAGPVSKESTQTVKSRVSNHYFFSRNALDTSPLDSEEKYILFKKFNSKQINPKNIQIKRNDFALITVQIKNNEITSELVESYFLCKLFKETNHFPDANTEI